MNIIKYFVFRGRAILLLFRRLLYIYIYRYRYVIELLFDFQAPSAYTVKGISCRHSQHTCLHASAC